MTLLVLMYVCWVCCVDYVSYTRLCELYVEGIEYPRRERRRRGRGEDEKLNEPFLTKENKARI